MPIEKMEGEKEGGKDKLSYQLASLYFPDLVQGLRRQATTSLASHKSQVIWDPPLTFYGVWTGKGTLLQLLCLMQAELGTVSSTLPEADLALTLCHRAGLAQVGGAAH